MENKPVSREVRIVLAFIAVLVPILNFFFLINFLLPEVVGLTDFQPTDYFICGIVSLIILVAGFLLFPIFRKRW